MSTIDRYKKKGGFLQLLNLIETSGKEKQERFLKLIADEAPHWETEIRKKMLNMDRILAWPPTYVTEIVARVQPMTLAMILGGLPAEKKELLSSLMNFGERRKIEAILSEKQPNAGESSAAIMKLFQEIRSLAADGVLRFEKFDEGMLVPENIEDLLSQGKMGSGAPTMAAISETQLKDVKVAPVGAGVPADVADELVLLRKKVSFLASENNKLTQENSSMKEKLEQIRKIA